MLLSFKAAWKPKAPFSKDRPSEDHSYVGTAGLAPVVPRPAMRQLVGGLGRHVTSSAARGTWYGSSHPCVYPQHLGDRFGRMAAQATFGRGPQSS
jgi:hypothetical protein